METAIRIREKAEELFWLYGIRSITMDEISAQMGISKKTIYQYYQDKDELVSAITEEKIRFSQTQCKKDAAEAANAIDEIFRSIEFIGVMFRNMSPSILFDLKKFHPKAFQKVVEYKHRFLMEMVKKNIERGIQEGLYQPEINSEVLTRFRLENMFLAFNPEVFPPSKFNILSVQTEMLGYFLYGVASLKGHKLILKYKNQRINQS